MRWGGRGRSWRELEVGVGRWRRAGWAQRNCRLGRWENHLTPTVSHTPHNPASGSRESLPSLPPAHPDSIFH